MVLLALTLGKGLKKNDISNRWHIKLKELSGIIKPPVQSGQHSSITWTAEDDATIVSMSPGGSSYTKIALALGQGLKKNDTSSRWHFKLKESPGIMEHKRTGHRGNITWTAEDDSTIARMKAGGSSFSDIAALSKGHKTERLCS